MSELGDLPRRSRSYDPSLPTRTGSERSRRDHSSVQRHSLPEQNRSGASQPGTRESMLQRTGNDARGTKRQRGNVWQILFGQGNKRLSRRSAPQQTMQKDFRTVSMAPPHHVFQRLKRSDRSRLSHHQANAMAEQVRQGMFERSQLLNGSSTASAAMPREKLPNPRQEARFSSQHSGRAIPAFQSLSHVGQERGQDQASLLARRREARQRTRRGFTKRHYDRDGAENIQGVSKVRSNAPIRKHSQTRPRSRSVSAGLYAARMLILSVGIGVLVGTLLSVLDPAARLAAGASQQTTKKADAIESTKTTQATAISQSVPVESAAALPKTGQELVALKAALQTLALQSPQLTPGIFLFDLDTTAYLDLNGGASFAAASTIKVPILIAFFQDVDAGKIRLDELLTLQRESVAGGSGELQGLPVGTQLTALETVTKMITISDNTATNMVIARLGGIAALNQRFRSWGLISTAINNMLPDLDGTNMTSPKEMAFLMTRISQGELVSMRSRDRLLDIMQRTANRSQLVQGLDAGATIAHKTGDIGGLIGDVGLIDMPNGKRYSLTVLVKRSFNDDRAYDLVQKASRIVYQYLNRTPQRPTVSPSAPSESLPRADKGATATPDRAPSMPVDTAVTQSPSLDTATR